MMRSDRAEIEKAVAASQRGDWSAAEKLCREILSYTPENAEVRLLLAKALQALGLADAAQTEYRAIAAQNPTYVDVWRGWAGLFQLHGFSKEAAICLKEGLKHVPTSSPLHNDLGMQLLALGDVEAAAVHLEKALALSPSSISALNNLGIVRKSQGRIDDAIKCYHEAIAIAPHMPELHNNLGDALRARDMDAAAAAFAKALELRPDYADALDGLGVVYFFKNKLEDALEKFEHAARVQPEFLRALAHKTTALFLLGRLPEAWALHRRRFAFAGTKGEPYERIPLPVWNGEPLTGKTLLIWTELGLGEEIMQASMFRDVEALADHVVIECSPRVAALFERSFPTVTFVKRENPSAAPHLPRRVDYQISAGDLGAFLRPAFDAFPTHAGYLRPDTQRTASLRQKYQAGESVRIVGLSWASFNVDIGALKSLSLMDFAPVLRTPGVRFVNLQYKANPAELAAVEQALGIRILTDETVDHGGDLDEIAAQVAAMDLVISVSNSTVHMAGALNVPVWNIVPGHNASPLWHWFHDISHSPWYPAMKLYRRRDKDPGPLMSLVAADLQHFLEKSKD